MILRLCMALGRACEMFASWGEPEPNRAERRGGASALLDRSVDDRVQLGPRRTW